MKVLLTYVPTLANDPDGVCMVDIEEISTATPYPRETWLSIKNGEKIWVRETPYEIYKMWRDERKKNG